jgi:hypothetical protein
MQTWGEPKVIETFILIAPWLLSSTLTYFDPSLFVLGFMPETYN